MNTLTLRLAIPRDVPACLTLLLDHAAVEKIPALLKTTESRLYTDLFGVSTRTHIILAEREMSVVGFALYTATESLRLSEPMLLLEKLYVRPPMRRLGVGRALVTHLAEMSLVCGHAGLSWACRDMSMASLMFAQAIGGAPIIEWNMCRVNQWGGETSPQSWVRVTAK